MYKSLNKKNSPYFDNFPSIISEFGAGAGGNIVDWKTGKCMTGKKLTTDLQPALYLKAIEHKYGKMPKTFTLIYLSDVDKKGNFKTRVFERINNNEFKCTVRGKDYIQNIKWR